MLTAGAPAQLELTADREVITADGRDVVHLTVQVLDAAGQRVPKADNLISFDIAGEGSLIGVDNGDPASHESFQAHERKAFNGLCLAIVKSTSQPGEIQVKVTSPGAEGKIHCCKDSAHYLNVISLAKRNKMEPQAMPEFIISPMRVQTLPEINFFYVAGKPVPFIRP